jgi:hypothetical protein
VLNGFLHIHRCLLYDTCAKTNAPTIPVLPPHH